MTTEGKTAVDQLENCPCCGGEAGVGMSPLHTIPAWIECLSCGLSIEQETVDLAVTAWNRRAAVRQRSGWRGVDDIPKDGRTVVVQATMRIHHMPGVRFPTMPPEWRYDTPQEVWSFTGWRELPPSEEGAVAERAEQGFLPSSAKRNTHL